MTVRVKKIGGSLAVVIPKSMAQELEMVEGTPLEISASGGTMVMRKQGRRPRRSISEIVAQINADSYRRRNRELTKDRPVGKEIW